MASIALVTCASARHLDEDLPPLVAAVAGCGGEPHVVEWDDPAVRWESFDLAVLRSTWDYPARRDEFLAWCRATAARTRLWNGPDVVAWSSDKRYLADLGGAGVPITPTTFLPPGAPLDPSLLHAEVVIKPSVGAGSVDALRFPPGALDAAAAHVARLHATGRTALVQPYLERVEADGETALVYIGGTFSHAFRKGAMLLPGKALVDGLFLEEDIAPRRPTDAELAVGEMVLSCIPGGRDAALYGRVDLVPGDAGTPVVLEVELVEPSVYVRTSDGAAERFAAEIIRRIHRPRPALHGA